MTKRNLAHAILTCALLSATGLALAQGAYVVPKDFEHVHPTGVCAGPGTAHPVHAGTSNGPVSSSLCATSRWRRPWARQK